MFHRLQTLPLSYDPIVKPSSSRPCRHSCCEDVARTCFVVQVHQHGCKTINLQISTSDLHEIANAPKSRPIVAHRGVTIKARGPVVALCAWCARVVVSMSMVVLPSSVANDLHTFLQTTFCPQQSSGTIDHCLQKSGLEKRRLLRVVSKDRTCRYTNPHAQARMQARSLIDYPSVQYMHVYLCIYTSG